MGKYQITIKDLETGETLMHEETDVVIGAVDRGKATGHFCWASGNAVDLSATVVGAALAVEDVLAKFPAGLAKKTREIIATHKNN